MGDESTTTGILTIEPVTARSSGAWRDAIVVSAAGGIVELAPLGGGLHRLTSFAPVAVGDPVALHPVADVLALGDEWYPARDASA